MSSDLFFDFDHGSSVVKAASGTDTMRQFFVAAICAIGQLNAAQRVMGAALAAA